VASKPWETYQEESSGPWDSYSSPIARSTASRQAEAALETEEAQAIERAQLGEQFHQPTDVIDYELRDPALRFKLSRVESADDALKLLQNSGSLPEGAMSIALEDPNGGRVMGFMIPGEGDQKNQFFKIDSPNEFSLSDVADLGNLASLETVGSVASAFAPAKSLVQRAAYEFMGALAGKSLDEIIDQMTGLEDQTLEQAATESIEAGLINAGAGRVADLGVAAKNLQAGRGFNLGDADATELARQEALDAGVRQELPAAQIGGPLTARATAISENIGSGIPGIRGVEGLSTARRSGVAEKLQGEAFGRTDEGILELELAQMGDKSILKLVNEAKKDAKATAKGGLTDDLGFPFRLTTKEEGGQSVFRGMDDFAERTRAATDVAYEDYFNVVDEAGLAYNVDPIIVQAQEFLKRYKLDTEAGGTVDFGPGMEPQFKELLEKVVQLKQVQDSNPLEATQALRAIRTQLLDLAEKTPGAGKKTVSQGRASKMLQTLHGEILANPQGVGGEGAKAAFEKANKLWADRTKVLNAFSFRQADLAEIGSGEKLYKSLTGDMTEDLARLAQKELPKEEFQNFQQAYITDLMRSPGSISAKLQAASEAGEVLIPENVRKTLGVFSRDMQNINKGVLYQLFDVQARDAQTVAGLIDGAAPQELRGLIKSGAMTNRDMQKHVFQDALDKTTSYRDGVLQVDPARLTSHIEKLKNGKFWEFLSGPQRNMMQDLETYSSFIKSADSGSSIAAAEIAAAQLQPLTNMAGAAKSRAKQIQIGIIANIGNSDTMAKIFAGRGAKPKPLRGLRAGLIGTMQSLHQMVESSSAKDLKAR